MNHYCRDVKGVGAVLHLKTSLDDDGVHTIKKSSQIDLKHIQKVAIKL